jgi:RNA polymerase sigma factor (sigma-70 family)
VRQFTGILDTTSMSEEGARVVARRVEDRMDRDMVVRVAQGDEAAFRDLFQRYGPVANALALRIVRRPSMAEEIVQEAFLALWRDPEAYRPDRGSVRAWLMSTVHHRAVDAVRREEARRRRAWRGEIPAAQEEDPAEAVVDRDAMVDTRGRVRAALRQIPPEQREVLRKMYFEGKTQTKIAEELALPLGTVKSRTLLAMRRLRTLLVEAEE